MSALHELQQLLIKMGGTPDSGDNIDETLRKITTVYTPGGGSSDFNMANITIVANGGES